MQAVLTHPIVTDFVPAAKPPWALLAVAVGVLAVAMPRDVLPEFCVASSLVALGGVGLNRLLDRLRRAGAPDDPVGPTG